MAGSEASTAVVARFQARLLAICAGLTLGLAGLGAWYGWSTYASFREVASDEMRLVELDGEIMRLDEVLTMSARMAAATGDLRWERRYDHYDPILAKTIDAVIALAPEAYGKGAAAETDVANQKLVAMERRAFGLVKRKDLRAATDVLASDEYGHQKKVYAQGMARSRRTADERAGSLLSTLHRRAVVSLGAGLGLLLLLGGCWVLIVRLIVRHLRARAEAEAALHTANATLEAKVAQRTAALEGSLDTLRKTQQELVSASRRAGMADVASAVLHNVGNVLNSVNVSSTFATDLVRGSKILGLAKASAMIGEHAGDLGAFMTSDARGKHLPQYLQAISGYLQEEHQALLTELESMQHNVNHVKTIISRQQEHAVSPARPVLESLAPAKLADEAIELLRRSCDRDGILVERSYETMPPACIDRHKTLQIVVNLLDNARQALARADRQRNIKVTVRRHDPQRFAIEVEDNGCGIAPEDLPKLFQHGFSTKADGHGLGLHASACMAQEIGGVLTGSSGGPGRGARFALVLPLDVSGT